MIDLKSVVTKYPECIESPEKLRAYLTDLYPNEKSSIFILSSIAASDIGEKIKQLTTISKFEVDALGKQLVNSFGINYDFAKESIINFDEAFDVFYNEPDGWFSKGLSCESNESYEEALVWYNKAAVSGHIKAQVRLAFLYENGLGTNLDYTLATYWYRTAAEKGDADAQNNYGICIINQYDTSLKIEDAYKWFLKAAVQNNSAAQLNIGDCYFEGIGVNQDVNEAKYWYEKADCLGDQRAKEKIILCQKHLMNKN